MTNTIKDITIFIDCVIDNETGREYVDGASMQIRDENFDLVAQISFHSVVKNEADLWNRVELTVERMIDKGHKIDDPAVHIWRSHQTRTQIDYFQAIGRHI